MKGAERSRAAGGVPVAVGFIAPPALRPGGAAVAASVDGVRDLWLFRAPLSRGEARSRFRERVQEGGAAPDLRAGAGAEAILRQALDQAARYFLGELREFSCPLDLEDRGAPFEARVWRELSTIPYGKTRSYGDIARALGRPEAARAVGRACGTNPIPLILPCHRVVGSDGSLTGYGGGLPLKELLLSIERSRRSTVDSRK